ncbi:MAG: AAA family ATPase, partial [Muribaculaceae bacterium]|nr:AAA family ATPase [Muribaculaceae bacterium]
MKIDKLDIVNFKNIEEASLEFSGGVNCLLGMNGMGKSNLLEAIHFLCLARTMQTLPESSIPRHGTDMMMVKGDFAMDTGVNENVSCGIVKGKGKTLKCNGKEYQRISEHIGRFPIVTVTPSDQSIVSGAAEERRKLMDMVISQADKTYLSHLIRYNRSIDSRNRMLRAGVKDKLLYESVESAM